MFNYTLTKQAVDNRSSDLTSGEFRLLIDTILYKDVKSYLELGVWHGVNLFKIADLLNVNEKECKIVGYDCFDLDPNDDNSHRSGWPSKEIAESVVAGYDSVELIQGFASELIEKLDGQKFDLVFHDANHAFDAVYNDVLSIKNILNPSAIVVLHNSEADDLRLNYGAKSAIDKLIQEGHYSFHSRVDRSTAIQPC